jgi:hypothetical protein
MIRLRKCYRERLLPVLERFDRLCDSPRWRPTLEKLAQALTAAKQAALQLPRFWVALVLMAAAVLAFWRPYYFFIHDDWRTLALMVDQPLKQYVLQPEGEEWFPIFHLAFFGLVRTFGDHYGWMILVTCLGTGLSAFLLYLFLKRHLRPDLALALSLFYAVAPVHLATAPMAFYLCYGLCLAFFLAALLLTDRFSRSPSLGLLLMIGLCGTLSVFSHNYTLLALAALPLYPLFTGNPGNRREFWALSAVFLALGLVFALGYFKFAGVKAASSINHGLFTRFPFWYFPLHWFAGAYAAPFTYVFYNDRLPPGLQLAIGAIFFGLITAVIFSWGNRGEKRLGLWALALNGLPFLTVSLVRCNFSLGQAFSHRYGVFTFLGALLLVGLAWTIAGRKLPHRPWAQVLLPLGVMAGIILGQFWHTPGIQNLYKDRSHIARITYEYYGENPADDLNSPEEASRIFLIPDYPFLTEGQIVAIRRFLQDPAGGPQLSASRLEP